MSDWGWVFLGFSITYASIAGYLVSLARRQAGLRRQAETQR